MSLRVDEAFCDECGSILPVLSKDGVTCFYCKKIFNTTVFKDATVKYKINFNGEIMEDSSFQSILEQHIEGPVVERKCPRCNNDRMSYATLQLRSADEGQTVFYTCTSCKFKEAENS
ncbi:DNA-directed RNA polymerase I subunit RPA12 isoform X2 [Coccinella septempunctata]|uniref:DNA-directed RNA polymerase I subunit RPA12 isoform X1 n=1 Tax=Coccinella septempunctata TaxID=41139 RepID=UPI001D088F51|nr:DNA-directed RNA polymerase I subunit RPA12 isoform X1 [Coccinella septempunctata]XP_044744487.1 DNA-directed RNA polymerase I subunit RPA12 isoform X2 [Coccinella septempunctata]